MAVVVYIDETGDHSLEAADKDFPVFALTLCIFDIATYQTSVVPRFYRFKMDYFKHEGVIFRSRNMRRSEREFAFLANPAKRQPFYQRLYDEMAACDYQVICVAIRKQKHKERYGKAAHNPYDMAMEFALERLLPLLEGLGQTEVDVIAESRGPKENAELEYAFLQVVTKGNYYISSDRFRKVVFRLHFVAKSVNIIGTQMADLAGFPIARHALDPKYSGPLLPIVQKKMYAGPGWVRGLKIFP